MDPYKQQQYYQGAQGYPQPGPAAGPYAAPPPPGYPPPQQGYGYPPPQQAAAPPGYAQYPPAMGIAGVPPGYGRPPPGAGAGPSYAPPPPPGGAKPPGFDVEAQAAATYAAAFVNKQIRSAFVRKVFILVFLQLAVTMGIAAVFLFVDPVREYVAGKQVCTTFRDGTESCYTTTPEGQWVFWASWGLTLAMLIALMCSTTLRRRHPWNYMAMAAFTVVMSVQVGVICAWWGLDVVLMAVAVTAAAVVGITLAAVFLPWDMTKRGHILAMVGMVVFFVSLATIFVAIWWNSTWWYLALSVVFALLFAAYLYYDIQMVLGNKKYAVSPDEYVFAAVQIYLDIVMLFLQMLSIIGIASR